MESLIQEGGYTLGQVIGSGIYSKVYKVEHNNTKTRHEMVCKWIDRTKMPDKLKESKLEVRISKRPLTHPYILRVYEVMRTKHSVCIFMRYYSKGTLHKRLQSEKKAFTERLTKRWFSQILGALAYIHSKGVVHRDIKLDNFMLNDVEDVLLTDFVFAEMSSDPKGDVYRDTGCGHPAYMAPEVFNETKFWPYDARAADVYSLGVCLFEMLNFDKPFTPPNMNKEEDIRSHVIRQRKKDYRLNDNIKKELSPTIVELIGLLLEPNPRIRITADQCLVHEGAKPMVN